MRRHLLRPGEGLIRGLQEVVRPARHPLGQAGTLAVRCAH